jgi:hypothetical protein
MKMSDNSLFMKVGIAAILLMIISTIVFLLCVKKSEASSGFDYYFNNVSFGDKYLKVKNFNKYGFCVKPKFSFKSLKMQEDNPINLLIHEVKLYSIKGLSFSIGNVYLNNYSKSPTDQFYKFTFKFKDIIDISLNNYNFSKYFEKLDITIGHSKRDSLFLEASFEL